MITGGVDRLFSFTAGETPESELPPRIQTHNSEATGTQTPAYIKRKKLSSQIDFLFPQEQTCPKSYATLSIFVTES